MAKDKLNNDYTKYMSKLRKALSNLTDKLKVVLIDTNNQNDKQKESNKCKEEQVSLLTYVSYFISHSYTFYC